MGQNPSLLEKINVDTDYMDLWWTLRSWQPWIFQKLGQSQMQHYIQSISSFDTWPNQKKTIHNAMAMLAPAATAPYAPWCSKPHGVTEQFRPWRARAKSCGRLVGFAAGRRLLWCGFTTKTSHAETIGPRFNSADLSINVLIVFGCVWMIFGEELIHFLVDLPWFTTLIPICQLRSEAWLRNGPDGLGLLSHIE